jgi:DNA-binding transcriptional ArsR family regulator
MPNMGIILPDMGKRTGQGISEAAALYARANLADALFATTRQRVLGHLFGQPERSFTVSELIHATGAGSGAVQRELARLAGSGLLTLDQVGNQKRYRANPDSPIHDELVAIVRKTFGLAEPLREALRPMSGHIVAAFVYGSVARRSDTASSDIDLMLISPTLTYADAMSALDPVAGQLGREINPTIYTPDEWRSRVAGGNSFVRRVMAQPRTWLIGGDDVLGA